MHWLDMQARHSRCSDICFFSQDCLLVNDNRWSFIPSYVIKIIWLVICRDEESVLAHGQVSAVATAHPHKKWTLTATVEILSGEVLLYYQTGNWVRAMAASPLKLSSKEMHSSPYVVSMVCPVSDSFLNADLLKKHCLLSSPPVLLQYMPCQPVTMMEIHPEQPCKLVSCSSGLQYRKSYMK